MPEPSSAFERAPLKEPEQVPVEEETEDRGERGSSFKELIPGNGRRFLFKSRKGRIGMG